MNDSTRYHPGLAPRFTELLLARENALRAVLDHTIAHATQADDTREVSDFKDAAGEQSLSSVDDAQADHAAHELKMVAAALRRIDDGTYGDCLDCGDPIDLRRLTALPATPYCTSCQSAREHAKHR